MEGASSQMPPAVVTAALEQGLSSKSALPQGAWTVWSVKRGASWVLWHCELGEPFRLLCEGQA